MSNTSIIPAEPQPVRTVANVGPMALIETGLASGATQEQLGELYAIYRQWMADEAERKYSVALTGFQSECPQIEKKRPVVNKAKELIYNFASLEDVDKVIRPLMAKHGIGIQVDPTKTENGLMHARCRVRVGSYYEDYTMAIPIAAIQAANATQQMLGTLSYVRRALICSALNVVCCGEDDDAQGVGDAPDTITATQLLDIRDLLRACPKDTESGLLNWLKLDSLDLIPRARFDEVVSNLKRKAAQK